MLEPDGRLHLSAALRPPPGFALSRAVATTFTLDLTSALVAPLAFAAFEIDQDKDPVAVMEAIRSVTDRVDIFCQAGNIAVPQAASDLMAFLEPMVHELPRPRGGHLFHPKVWVLRYVSPDGEVEFRLVCGSRNLTPDSAWDAAVTLDGRPGPRLETGNNPLVNLLRYVVRAAPRLSENRAAQISAFADELRRAAWDFPDQVNEIAFHSLGTEDRPRQTMDFSGRRHLVVSPFLEPGGIARIVGDSPDSTVVSRPESFERLPASTLATLSRLYCVSGMAELGDPDDVSTGGPASLHGLHAKVIVVERARQAHLFIGSANATDAALGGNVEFMVELTAGVSALGIDALVGADSGFAPILEPYTATGGEAPSAADELEKALDNFLRSAAESGFVVQPHADSEGTYEVGVRGDALSFSPEWTVTVALLSSPNGGLAVRPDLPIELSFPKQALADVGPFLVIRVRAGDLERSTVVRATLLDDPPDRLDAVLARQVDTPEKLLRFLMLVLGFGTVELDAVPVAGEGGAGWSFGGGSSALFELIVRATAERPAVLLQIDRLLTRMQQTEQGRSLLPSGLAELWEAVRPLLPEPEEVPA